MKKKLSGSLAPGKIVALAVAAMLAFSPVKAEAVDWKSIFLIGTFCSVGYIMNYFDEKRFYHLSPKEQAAEIKEIKEKIFRLGQEINRKKSSILTFNTEQRQLDREVIEYKNECIRLKRYVSLHTIALQQNLQEQELRQRLEEQQQQPIEQHI